jgi:hypothetical protein
MSTVMTKKECRRIMREYDKKYSYLSVYDGFHCIDFDFGGIIFAAYSSQALIEMGVTTKEEVNLYVECALAIS